MDFLLDNPLATMDGPAFLVLFGTVVVLALIGVAIPRLNSDKTDQLPTPVIPPEPDPFEIAFLRGGINEMARAVIFSLIHKGFIDIVSDGKTSILKPNCTPEHAASLCQVEQQAMRWLVTEREIKNVFETGTGLLDQLRPFGTMYRDALERRQLLSSEATLKQLRRIGRIAASAIALLGGYKVAASIAYGYYNVAFTIIMTIAAVVVIISVVKLPRLTKLGQIYIDRLRLAFDDLKRTSQASYIRSPEQRVLPQASAAGVDPLLISVGLFGSGILAGTVFDDYNAAFQRAQQNSSSSGGCGSSCGSGCSSGSDGGGSSCGGGCGGGGCGGGCGG